jgi:hypothetical protein
MNQEETKTAQHSDDLMRPEQICELLKPEYHDICPQLIRSWCKACVILGKPLTHQMSYTHRKHLVASLADSREALKRRKDANLPNEFTDPAGRWIWINLFERPKPKDSSPWIRDRYPISPAALAKYLRRGHIALNGAKPQTKWKNGWHEEKYVRRRYVRGEDLELIIAWLAGPRPSVADDRCNYKDALAYADLSTLIKYTQAKDYRRGAKWGAKAWEGFAARTGKNRSRAQKVRETGIAHPALRRPIRAWVVPVPVRRITNGQIVAIPIDTVEFSKLDLITAFRVEMPLGWPSARQLSDESGINRRQIENAGRAGEIDRKLLPAPKGKGRHNGAEIFGYRRQSFDAYKRRIAERANLPTEKKLDGKYEDGHGVWRSSRWSAERLGVTIQRMNELRKFCPWTGTWLRAKEIVPPWQSILKKTWVYFEEGIEQARAKKKGLPWPPPAPKGAGVASPRKNGRPEIEIESRDGQRRIRAINAWERAKPTMGMKEFCDNTGLHGYAGLTSRKLKRFQIWLAGKNR